MVSAERIEYRAFTTSTRKALMRAAASKSIHVARSKHALAWASAPMFYAVRDVRASAAAPMVGASGGEWTGARWGDRKRLAFYPYLPRRNTVESEPSWVDITHAVNPGRSAVGMRIDLARHGLLAHEPGQLREESLTQCGRACRAAIGQLH